MAKFDRMVRERRAELPKVGMATVDAEVLEAPVEIVETKQPRNYMGDEWETDTDRVLAGSDNVDYAKMALESL